MTEETQILPCPFCGKKARSWRQGFIRKLLVACSDNECGAYFIKCPPEEWNTRTPPQSAGADPDMPAQQLRLHFGELTDDELRLVRAAIRFANRRIAIADGVGV